MGRGVVVTGMGAEADLNSNTRCSILALSNL